MSTLMGCVGPWGDFEGVFMAAFVGPLRTSMAADQLVLTGPKGVIVLVAAGA
jgi:heat shock protein HslJ